MTHENLYKALEDVIKFSTILELKLLEKEDINVCNYLINNLPKIDYNINIGKEISRKELIETSLNDFKKFNISNYLKLKYIFNNTKIKTIDENHFFAVQTSFKKDFFDNINPKSGRVNHYEFPPKLFEIDAISLGHEHCHALKGTNYFEHQYIYVIGETIPIFYELINYERDELRKNNLAERITGLNRDIEIFLETSYLLNKQENSSYNLSYFFTDHRVYNFARSYSGVYLNSFYYAIILYNMYKQNPRKILNLVSLVLKKEITTYDMLNKLNIYYDIQGETFEKEMSNIKRILTK